MVAAAEHVYRGRVPADGGRERRWRPRRGWAAADAVGVICTKGADQEEARREGGSWRRVSRGGRTSRRPDRRAGGGGETRDS